LPFVKVLPCRLDDLDVIETAWPRRGMDERFARHVCGASTLLIARERARLAGRIEVMWTGPREAAVRASVGLVPEMNGLDVLPAWRGRGVGSALIAAAEELARRRGHPYIGLGVGFDNTAAERLYRSLGYTGDLRYVDGYLWRDEDDVQHQAQDSCRFLTKPLGSVAAAD